MGLKANNQAANSSKFKKPEALEAGGYPGRLVQVLDFGLQPQRAYQGQEKEPAHEIHVTYELSDEFLKDEEGNDLTDKPRWISETFPLYSMQADLAKSTKRAKAIDPSNSADGDWSQMLTLPCTITVVVNKGKDGKDYENVGNVTTIRPKDAAKLPELVNKPRFFDLTEPDLEIFNKLPQWIKDKIVGNLEYPGSLLEKLLKGDAPKATPKKKEAVVEAPEAPAEESDVPW